MPVPKPDVPAIAFAKLPREVNGPMTRLEILATLVILVILDGIGIPPDRVLRAVCADVTAVLYDDIIDDGALARV